ncbi:MAG: hypothetical protein WC934_08410 [Acidithiobacillus sp.]|jgi:hypothetical protein|uniref:hypothetical protein n=1 Tax=Acidithiobacillus sp. TaxID=1872118 RepID=UPI00355D533C
MGLQIDINNESEFKGYIVRALQGIDKDMEEIEKNLKILNDAYIRLKLTIVVIGAVFGVLGTIIGNVIVLIIKSKFGLG